MGVMELAGRGEQTLEIMVLSCRPGDAAEHSGLVRGWRCRGGQRQRPGARHGDSAVSSLRLGLVRARALSV